MRMNPGADEWSEDPKSTSSKKGQRSKISTTEFISKIRESIDRKSGNEDPTQIWLNPDLRTHDATANLDDQQPATLYYLGLVKDVPQVAEVYVEELEKGRRKHWTVLSERDYEAMDRIYEIEEDTLNRFPGADLGFRVTVMTDDGPSISSNATKIFDTK